MFVARSTILAALSFVALMCLIGLLGACAAPPEIRIEKDPAADLRAYKTFAFSDPGATGRTPYTTILGGGLHNATRERLEQAGFVYRREDPDLRVTLVFNAASRRSERGGSGDRALADGAARASDREGLVTIDLVDARRNVVVWQGVAFARADQDVARNPWPAIGSAVDEILAAFPGYTIR